MNLTITSIKRGMDAKGRPRTLIRCGDDETEIPGGDAELKEWITGQAERVDAHAVAGMSLAEQVKLDPSLGTLGIVAGREFSVAIKEIEKVIR